MFQFKRLLYIPVCIFLNFSVLSSQNTGYNNQNIKQTTQNRYGVNDVLVNGKLYYPFHKGVEGHSYFLKNEFVGAEININRQAFTNIPVKYDIEQQKMIIKVIDNKNSLKLIVLNPERIDSIKLEDRLFLPSDKISSMLPAKRYYECIWNKRFKYVVYHHITFDPKKNRRNIIPGGYTSVYSDKHIISNDKVYNVNRKRSFLKYFSVNKKDISSFMKLNKIKYRKADNSRLKLLMNYCYEHTSN